MGGKFSAGFSLSIISPGSRKGQPAPVRGEDRHLTDVSSFKQLFFHIANLRARHQL